MKDFFAGFSLKKTKYRTVLLVASVLLMGLASLLFPFKFYMVSIDGGLINAYGSPLAFIKTTNGVNPYFIYGAWFFILFDLVFWFAAIFLFVGFLQGIILKKYLTSIISAVILTPILIFFFYH